MKYLHTMVRVTDIEQSLRFYRDALGLVELSRKDYPQGRYTLAACRKVFPISDATAGVKDGSRDIGNHENP